MRTRRLECTVCCADCNHLLGTVYAVEESDRPGFWTNVSIRPIAKECECGSTERKRVEPTQAEARVRESIT